MIKILHCADIHLDTPFNMSDINKAQIMRTELKGAFSALTTYVRIENIDIVLIAGDMFDSDFVTEETVAFVKREFELCGNCRFIISPGNHDPYTMSSVWVKYKFPDNVYIFSSPSLECFSFEEINTDVYGYAFTSKTMDFCPFSGYTSLSADKINILCGHGDMLSSDSHTCPISLKDIESCGFDYIALGHIHQSDGIVQNENRYFGYSGSLTGRDFGECGHKGAFCVEMEKKSGVFSASVRGKRFSKRRFETLDINATGVKTNSELLDLISREISEMRYGDDVALKLTISGDVSPEVTLTPKRINDFIGDKLFYVTVVDKTSPLFDFEHLKNDPTIRGVFFNSLLPDINSDDAAVRERAIRALKYGLSALSGNDISRI